MLDSILDLQKARTVSLKFSVRSQVLAMENSTEPACTEQAVTRNHALW